MKKNKMMMPLSTSVNNRIVEIQFLHTVVDFLPTVLLGKAQDQSVFAVSRHRVLFDQGM